MKRTVRNWCAGSVAVLLWAAPSIAGVLDSPLPVLTPGGPAAKYVFTVPGVIKHLNLSTDFVCTSLDGAPFKFAVQVFSALGGPPLNDVTVGGNGVEVLNQGETRTIGIRSTIGVHEDQIVSLTNFCNGGDPAYSACNPNVECPGGGTCTAGTCVGGSNSGNTCNPNAGCSVGACSAAQVSNGSARIVSQSMKITCSAFVLDRVSNPPNSMTLLNVVKAKLQKGD